MIKLYVTAIESKEDGSETTLFEDFMVTGRQVEQGDLHEIIYNKIEEVEKINNQVTSPF